MGKLRDAKPISAKEELALRGAATTDAREFWLEVCRRRDARPVAPWTDEECAALRRFNAEAGAPPAVLEAADRLADPRSLVVVAGQQPGLFLTPLYILYKAVAAIKWARRLGELLSRPVIPVFWIGSDDHDFDEISRAHYLSGEGALVSWDYGARTEEREPEAAGRIARGRSVFDVAVDRAALLSFLDDVDRDTRPTEFKERRLGAWKSIVNSSINLENLFAKLLTELLGDQGLVVLSARLMPLRLRARATLRREIERPTEVSALIKKTGDEAKALGGRAALHRDGDEVNFFIYRLDASDPRPGALRCKVTFSGGDFLVSHPATGELIERTNAARLLAELRESPEHFSPNVATRPIVQDCALPTLAMVAGPGEQEYLAQVRGVYELFDVFQSHAIPRPRVLLIEPRIERHLATYGVQDEALVTEDWRTVEERFLRGGESGSAIGAVEDLRRTLAAAFAHLSGKLARLEKNPAVQSAVSKTSAKTSRAIDALDERVREEVRAMQEADSNHLRQVMTALCPGGQPQERVLGPLAPFLINYGPRFVSWLFASLDLDCRRVQVLRLTDMGSSAKTP